MTPGLPTVTEERVRLLESLERRIARASDQEHRLARLRRILTGMVTRLRMGESAGMIQAEMRLRRIKG